MIDLRLWEMLGWPLLAAGFAWHYSGRRRAAQVWAGATVALIAVAWVFSVPDSANRARISGLFGLLGWGLALAVPVGLYALLIRSAHRRARRDAPPREGEE